MTSPQPAIELAAPAADYVEAQELLEVLPAADSFVDQLELAAADGRISGELMFGSAVSAGTFAPIPVVTIAGQDLRPDPGGVDAGLVVIDDVSITWGREDVLDQPTPATGRLRVLDLTNRWATATDRRGQLVTLRWEGVSGGAALSGVYFRGRIGAPVTVAAREVVHPVSGEVVWASVVDLPLQSILVDLANRIPTVAWPQETLGARADRVQAEAVAAGALTSVIVRDYWRAVNVAPVAAADQVSILDHLVALYDSSGADRMTYVPGLQRTENLLRRDLLGRGLVGLSWDPPGTGAARDGQGVYARSYSITAAGGVTPSVAMYVDAAALEFDLADGVVQPSLVTLVQVTHKDDTASYAQRTTTQAVTGTNEAVTGRRTASLESLVVTPVFADVARGDLESIVRREGSAWRLPPVRYSTRKLGGFERTAQAQLLLLGAETNSMIFLERSLLPTLGIRPLFGIMGATIRYAKNGWDIDLNLHPVTLGLPTHAITWEEIDDGSAGYTVEWHDGDHPKGMHESLTLDDMAFIQSGLNVTSANTGPDAGWDTTY